MQQRTTLLRPHTYLISPNSLSFKTLVLLLVMKGKEMKQNWPAPHHKKKPLKVLLRTAVVCPQIVYPVPPVSPPRENTVLRVKSKEHHGSQSFWHCERLTLFNFVLLTFPEVMSSLGQDCIISEFDGTSKIMLLCFPPYGVLPSKNFLKVGHLALA